MLATRTPWDAATHDAASRRTTARLLASLKGFEDGGVYDASFPMECPLYVVPDDTLTSTVARRLGIRTEDDLFGGVVPHAFVATKVITHPLVSPDAAAPDGWTTRFVEHLGDAALPGFSVFNRQDLRVAAIRLLDAGEAARIKPARGIGGHGQSVVRSMDELDALLPHQDPDELERHGAVVECDLHDAITYSIGQVHVDDLDIAYIGTQRVTRNHAGETCYGGSDLCVVRGRMPILSRLALSADRRLAIERAWQYDTAATIAFPGFLASRRNYDVVQGVDSNGRRRIGVLEQSWRRGGATPAELAALQAFRDDAARVTVRVSSHEVYGVSPPPAGAVTYFSGVDPVLGAMCKYSLIETDGSPTGNAADQGR
ncbi:MAG: DUF3182 family protein [Burkholderiales bacterium]|nr:DUF3182 family protein [Burkholderiales bacterium]